MPNHVINKITYDGSYDKVVKMLESVASERDGLPAKFGTIDFNKVIPMPESLKIESSSRLHSGIAEYAKFIRQLGDECPGAEKETEYLAKHDEISAVEWELGKVGYYNVRQYGHQDWYGWSIEHWGTKWNAYDDYGDEKGREFCFNTAWSAPHPVIKRLSEMYPDITFVHKWADEDIGNNCGEREYKGGRVTYENTFDNMKEAMDFSFDLWGYTPEEYGLRLSDDGTEYVYEE